jgi:hypothetical protein
MSQPGVAGDGTGNIRSKEYLGVDAGPRMAAECRWLLVMDNRRKPSWWPWRSRFGAQTSKRGDAVLPGGAAPGVPSARSTMRPCRHDP